MKQLTIILLILFNSFSSFSQDFSNRITGNWKCYKRELVNGGPDSLLYLHPSKYRKCGNFLSVDSLNIREYFADMNYRYTIEDSILKLVPNVSGKIVRIKKLSSDTLILEEYKVNNVVNYRWSYFRTKESYPQSPKLDGTLIYTLVESMPSFPGGPARLKEIISQNLTYPVKARQQYAEGTVMVELTISKSGKIADAVVRDSPRMDMAIEAINVVKQIPDWSPGKQGGNPVPVKMIIPVRFKL